MVIHLASKALPSLLMSTNSHHSYKAMGRLQTSVPFFL